MASITGVITKAKFVDGSGNDVTADIRDAASSHYLGRLINDTAPTTASITIDNGSSGIAVTAKANDWVLLKTEATAYIYTGSAWVKFAEANVINEIVVGEGTITPVNGVVTISEIPADIVGSTGHMTLSTGVQAATPSADGDVANKKYVDDAVQDITSAMVFKGGVTASTASSTTTLTLADATLGNINAGYTFKFTADEAGGDTFKIGDIIIANEDITHTAGATITYDASKWTIVPSGDDVDVTSVGIDAATGLKLSGGGTEITSTGTIQLNLGNTSGVTEDSTTTTKINVGVDTNNKLSANIGKLTADAVHTGTATTASAITAAVLKALLDEKQDALTLGTYLQWNSSTGALEHKDSGVTAVTTAGVKKITVDAQGHVTGASDPTKVTVKEVDTVNTVVDALTTAAPTAAAPTNAISYCDYDSTTGTVTFNQIGYTTSAAITTSDVANVVTD